MTVVVTNARENLDRVCSPMIVNNPNMRCIMVMKVEVIVGCPFSYVLVAQQIVACLKLGSLLSQMTRSYQFLQPCQLLYSQIYYILANH